MMYDTSVTILIISPNMNDSNWIPWEISYCLKEISRKDRTSKTNGIVGVVMEQNNSCNWFMKRKSNKYHDGNVIECDEDKVPEIVRKNRYNSNPAIYHCDKCKYYDGMYGSYISYVEEKDFLKNPNKYIEIAYNKAVDVDKYTIIKQID